MTSSASPARVLWVDDDTELLSLVQEALEEDGYAITPAASLPESLRALEEQLFHFVLTDLFSQPEHSPLQSIQPLLELATPIPVGVLTAWNLPEEAAVQADLAFLLRKPFELDDLERRLHAHIHPTLSRPHQHLVVEAFFEALNARDWKRLAQLCTHEVRVASLAAPAVTPPALPVDCSACGPSGKISSRACPATPLRRSRSIAARWAWLRASWRTGRGAMARSIERQGRCTFAFRVSASRSVEEPSGGPYQPSPLLPG